jgi:hypothetical protein
MDNVKTRPYGDLNAEPIETSLLNRQVVLIEDDPIQLITDEQIVGAVTTTYIGRAACGVPLAVAKWAITQVIEDTGTGITTKKWANGDAKFDKVWNDRATLDYL